MAIFVLTVVLSVMISKTFNDWDKLHLAKAMCDLIHTAFWRPSGSTFCVFGAIGKDVKSSFQ
jgi:hypothetical protein